MKESEIKPNKNASGMLTPGEEIKMGLIKEIMSGEPNYSWCYSQIKLLETMI